MFDTEEVAEGSLDAHRRRSYLKIREDAGVLGPAGSLLGVCAEADVAPHERKARGFDLVGERAVGQHLADR